MKTKRTRITAVKVFSTEESSINIVSAVGNTDCLKKRLLSNKEKAKKYYNNILPNWIEYSNQFKPEWAKRSIGKERKEFDRSITSQLAKEALEGLFECSKAHKCNVVLV
jgi:hypothetical protein